jgi:hypothetical protein
MRQPGVKCPNVGRLNDPLPAAANPAHQPARAAGDDLPDRTHGPGPDQEAFVTIGDLLVTRSRRLRSLRCALPPDPGVTFVPTRRTRSAGGGGRRARIGPASMAASAGN